MSRWVSNAGSRRDSNAVSSWLSSSAVAVPLRLLGCLRCASMRKLARSHSSGTPACRIFPSCICVVEYRVLPLTRHACLVLVWQRIPDRKFHSLQGPVCAGQDRGMRQDGAADACQGTSICLRLFSVGAQETAGTRQRRRRTASTILRGTPQNATRRRSICDEHRPGRLQLLGAWGKQQRRT